MPRELSSLMWMDAYAEPDCRPQTTQVPCAPRFGIVLCREDAQRVRDPRSPRALDNRLAIAIKCRVGEMTMRIDQSS